MWRWSKGDEKLTAIGVGARIGHCETTSSVICQYRLILEFVAGTTRASTLWVTCLNDELGYDAVEFQPIIKMVLCQENKVIDRVRRQLWIKFQYDQASIGIDTCTIHFLDIYRHSRSLAVGMCNLIEGGSTWPWRAIREFANNR